MLIRLLSKKAQSTIEYAVLFSFVAAAIIAMHLYLKGAFQANLKTTERELNREWREDR